MPPLAPIAIALLIFSGSEEVTYTLAPIATAN